MAQNSYQTINLTANLTLSWPFSFTGGPTIADYNDVSATSNIPNWKIILPDATLSQPGQNVRFNNISSNAFDIVANDGITPIATIAPAAFYLFYLSDTSTSNGNWVATPANGIATPINSVIAKSSDNTVTITGGTLTPPGGTINFQLPSDIANLKTNITVPGFLVAKTTNPLTFASRDFLGDTNIQVNNSDGINGDPVISLNPAGLTGIASAAFGNLQLSGDLITTNVVNGGIQLSSAGTGKVSINGVQIDTSGNITGGNNLVLNGSLTIGGTFASPTVPKAIFTFTDDTLGITSPTPLSKFNISSIVRGTLGANKIYTITFINPIGSAIGDPGYGITFGSGNDITVLGVPPYNNYTVYTVTRTSTYVNIIILDSSGNPIQPIPFSVTGIIWLPT